MTHAWSVRFLLLATATVTLGVSLNAADTWIEVKTAHVTVTSNASESATKTLAWQIEQIRSAISTLWPWARVDLSRPLAVIALKDENSMRVLAPQYWELRGGVRPASVWVSAPDRHYLAIRTDVRGEDRDILNPHTSAYFSYVSLILQQNAARDVPHWVLRGLAGVLSNTIVRESHVMVGAPIPWHLERLRERSRYKVPELLAVTSSTPELRTAEGELRYDAQTWAFVHFLMFGDQGARRPKFDEFLKLVSGGTDPDKAMRDALGPPEALETPFLNYINRSIFGFSRVNIDVSVKREGFATRRLQAAEAIAMRAQFHVAMRRDADARRAIAEARKTDERAPGNYVAEAMLLDGENKDQEAKAAFTRAVEAGSTSDYAHYRLASLTWKPDADRETLLQVEKLLLKTTALNNRHADAYAFLGEVRSMLESGEPLGLIGRAIALEPFEPRHRLSAARVLWRTGSLDEALKLAQIARSLAKEDDDRKEAQEMIASIERAKAVK